MSKWKIFKTRVLHFTHFNIKSLLPKIEELRHIAKLTNFVVIGVSEQELKESILEPEIRIHNYEILRCDRNRHEKDITCYILHI